MRDLHEMQYERNQGATRIFIKEEKDGAGLGHVKRSWHDSVAYFNECHQRAKRRLSLFEADLSGKRLNVIWLEERVYFP